MRKLNTRNIMRVVSANAVRGRLSENYLTRKFIARNIFDTKYSRFTVISLSVCRCCCCRPQKTGKPRDIGVIVSIDTYKTTFFASKC